MASMPSEPDLATPAEASAVVSATWRPAGDPPPLDDGTVHVWRIPLDGAVDASWLLLDADERARAEGYARGAARARFVVAHGTARRLLARYVGADAASLRFRRGPHGKPSLDRPFEGAGIEFSRSYAADLGLLAVVRGRAVGVDLERWDDAVDHRALAERFFGAALDQAAFFDAWVRREAHLKAMGVGLARGVHAADGDAPRRWVGLALPVAPRHSAALVSEAALRRVELLDVRER
jgi:4'-phosphopantetheinyl transferase